MYDIFRATPTVQELLREAHEAALARGREQGILQGRREAFYSAIMALVTTRFPRLEQIAHVQVAPIIDSARLHEIIVKLTLAQNAHEAAEVLLMLDDDL